MTRVKFDVGASADIPSLGEHKAMMKGLAAEIEYERQKGKKHFDLPELQGVPASGLVELGASGTLCGPRAGFAWSLRRVVVYGLTAGATPDVMNMYKNRSGSGTAAPLWQFNGNNFGYTFGRGEMVLKDGDILLFRSSGTFAATGQITTAGELDEVPMERIGEFF